jgi:phage I-like protein|tara:strand:- start:459 stop:746 length:288 start_codon:yes stop_codon:yes gene_type:complete
MTVGAYAIHEDLANEGFDLTSDDYYSELDKRLRVEFPQKFENNTTNGGTARVASADSSASRSTKKGRRAVKLTPSQVAIAKKLGVSLEDYAKHVK